MTVGRKFDTATGTLVRYVPEGPHRDELLSLVRVGMRFKAEHVGRRPGFLNRYIAGAVQRMELPATFALLLEVLELAAARRASDGEGASPIETVNRVWELVTFHDPKRGRRQITFGALRNYLTIAKKNKFPCSPKP